MDGCVQGVRIAKDKKMTDLFGTEEIRALNWKQPYASLMLHGKIETRTWDTKYRGLVLICASKLPYGFEAAHNNISGKDQWDRLWFHLDCPHFYDDFPLGKAIGIGRLADCRKMTPADEDACFVKYNENLFCHVYEDVKSIEQFDWKGAQKWKTLDNKTINKIKISNYI